MLFVLNNIFLFFGTQLAIRGSSPLLKCWNNSLCTHLLIFLPIQNFYFVQRCFLLCGIPSIPSLMVTKPRSGSPDLVNTHKYSRWISHYSQHKVCKPSARCTLFQYLVCVIWTVKLLLLDQRASFLCGIPGGLICGVPLLIATKPVLGLRANKQTRPTINNQLVGQPGTLKFYVMPYLTSIPHENFYDLRCE